MALSALSFALLLSLPVVGAETPAGNYARPDLLVEAGDLVKAGELARFRILDTRSKQRYEDGHIPGAFSVEPKLWGTVFMSSPDQAKADAIFTVLGIEPDTKVVLYHENELPEVARVWFILRHYGVTDVRLLNGGWLAWEKVGGPVSKETPPAFRVKQTATPVDGRLATKKELLQLLKDQKTQVVDARSSKEFTGEQALAKRNGCVPGAANLEWKAVVDPATQRFKQAAELEELFKKAGIGIDKPTVTYCHGGGRAAVMAFTLELMGAKNVKNYYKSWAEWGNDEETPVATPKAPGK